MNVFILVSSIHKIDLKTHCDLLLNFGEPRELQLKEEGQSSLGLHAASMLFNTLHNFTSNHIHSMVSSHKVGTQSHENTTIFMDISDLGYNGEHDALAVADD